MKQSELIKDRLKQAVLQRNTVGAETLLRVLKSDLTVLFSDYMSLEQGAVEIVLEATPDGKYEFTVKAKADRLIETGRMIVEN